jgi:MSHA biogenesis protein MshJ
MKARLKMIASRIDARTLRERVLLFVAVAAAIVFLLYWLFLNPLLARQTALNAQIAQQRDNIGGIDGDISRQLQAYEINPDAVARARLAVIETDTAQLASKLRAMQRGLVAPERIAGLLESILKTNGRLQLVSMKTLSVSPISDGAYPLKTKPARLEAAPVAEPVAPAAPERLPMTPLELLYRHGVELTVRGNYLDMVNYMDALQAMPTQLFWGRAELAVEEYPNARLTLTLYTLSLDKKWMKL